MSTWSATVYPKQIVAIKLESIVNSCHLEHKYKVLNQLSGGKGVPQPLWFSREGSYQAMVLEHLGPSLDKLLQASLMSMLINLHFQLGKLLMGSPSLLVTASTTVVGSLSSLSQVVVVMSTTMVVGSSSLSSQVVVVTLITLVMGASSSSLVAVSMTLVVGCRCHRHRWWWSHQRRRWWGRHRR